MERPSRLLAVNHLRSFDSQDIFSPLRLPLRVVTDYRDAVVVVPEIVGLASHGSRHSVIDFVGLPQVPSNVPCEKAHANFAEHFTNVLRRHGEDPGLDFFFRIEPMDHAVRARALWQYPKCHCGYRGRDALQVVSEDRHYLPAVENCNANFAFCPSNPFFRLPSYPARTSSCRRIVEAQAVTGLHQTNEFLDLVANHGG